MSARFKLCSAGSLFTLSLEGTGIPGLPLNLPPLFPSPLFRSCRLQANGCRLLLFIFPLASPTLLPQYVVCRHVVGGHMESLPMSEPVLLILLSLAGQPRHG